MSESTQKRAAANDERHDAPREDSLHAFWGWFALGLLVFCWIAEASMCAARGF